MKARSLLAVAALAFACGACVAADVNKGAELYARHCAGCHGARGVPPSPSTPNLTKTESLMRPDAALATLIRNGRMAMPGYRGILRDSEVYDVIAVLRTLLK